MPQFNCRPAIEDWTIQGKKGPCDKLVDLPLLGLLQARLFCSVC